MRLMRTSADAASITAATARHEDRRFTRRARRINRSSKRGNDGSRARLLRRSVRMKGTISRASAFSAALLLGSSATTLAQAPRAPAPLPAPRFIVVSNERSHDLTLLDDTTLEPVGSIPVPGRARSVRISPDHKFVYVALSDDRPQTPGPNDAIVEVDLATRQIVRRIP